MEIIKNISKWNRLNFEGKDVAIDELYEMYQNGKINFDPEYQRQDVWNVTDKQTLIDSILSGTIIGLLLFNRKGGILDVVDGQQRLKAIFEFMDGCFSTNPKITPSNPISYEDIANDKEAYHKFMGFKIATSILNECPDDLVAEFFIRINSGSTLTPAEKLHAEPSVLNKQYIQKYVQHPLFTNIRLKNNRSILEHNMAKLISVLLTNDNIINKELRVGSITSYEYLRKFYVEYKFDDGNLPKKKLLRIFQTLDIMNKYLKGDYTIFKSRIGDFYPLFLLFYIFSDNKIMNLPTPQEMRDFLNKFYTNVEQAKNMNPEDLIIDNKLSSYLPYIDHHAEAIGKKTPVLFKFFFSHFPNVDWNNEQRIFNHSQKLAIYHRDKGICQNLDCNEKVGFDEFHADHKIRFIDGGKTTVENGQVLCPTCNLKKG
jgi:hypothetical protein